MYTELNEAVFEAFPELESDRLVYRPFEAGDAADLFFLKTDARVMAYMDTQPYTAINDAEVAIQRNQKAFADKKGINWALIDKASQEFIGYFGYWRLFRENCRGEIGYSLKPTYWGQGYMTEAFQTLIPFGFEQIRLHSIEANINPDHQSSEQLLVNFGFKKEAHFRENYFFNGRFLDSHIYCLLASDLK